MAAATSRTQAPDKASSEIRDTRKPGVSAGIQGGDGTHLGEAARPQTAGSRRRPGSAGRFPPRPDPGTLSLEQHLRVCGSGCPGGGKRGQISSGEAFSLLGFPFSKRLAIVLFVGRAHVSLASRLFLTKRGSPAPLAPGEASAATEVRLLPSLTVTHSHRGRADTCI